MDRQETEAVVLIALAVEHFSWNGAGHLTCDETDDMALGLARLGHRDVAIMLLVGHGSQGDDDPEDRHAAWYDTDEDAEALAEAYLSELET